MIKETYSGEAIDELIKFFKLEIDGILHVGAHRCEELNVYLKYIDIKNIVWVEALKFLVDENLKKNTDLIIINEVVSDQDGKEIEFKITNNTLSSSILEFGYHAKLHPNVIVNEILKLKTKTLKSIINENNLKNKFNMLTLDIQGAEPLALMGMGDLLNNLEIIYTEVNEVEIYKGCCIISDIDSYLNKFNFERKYLNTLNYYGNALYIKKH